MENLEIQSLTPIADELAKKMFGKSRTEAMSEGICVICHQPTEDFRDEFSRKEWEISGMCQVCQDKVFGE